MLTAVAKQEIKLLTEERRNAALIELATTYVPLGGAFYLLYSSNLWWTGVIAFAVIGIMQYRLVMSCHEAVHKNLLYPLWLNECVGLIHGSIVGINFTRYRQQHLLHHRAPDVAVDPDAYIYGPILAAPAGWRRVAVWILGLVPEVVEKFRQKGLSTTSDAGLAAAARRDSIVMVVANAALLALFTWFGAWWSYFVFWVLPVVTISVFLNRTRVWIEHGYPLLLGQQAGCDLATAPLETVDVRSNRYERYLLAPFNFNYHFTHHSVPTVPFYNNPRLSVVLGSSEPVPRAEVTYTWLLLCMLKGRQ